MTEHSEYRFTVKETPSREDEPYQPWIFMELLRGKSLSILKSGFLGFDLPEGTTYEQASEFAALLNEKVTVVHYTDLNDD